MTDNHQTVILGNSADINITTTTNNEIRADILVDEYTPIKLWGQILNTSSQPVPDISIKLVKIEISNDTSEYQDIAHTTSDAEGFYQFNLCSKEDAWYKILVGKSNTGKEIIMNSIDNACPNHI